MSNITQIIEKLERLSKEAHAEKWHYEKEQGDGSDGAAFLMELINNYQIILNTLHAAEELATAIEEIAPTTNAQGSLAYEVWRYREALVDCLHKYEN